VKVFFLIMLVYPGWKVDAGPMTIDECLARKHLRAAETVQTPNTPLIRFECVANWNVPDKILWSF